MRKIKSKKIIIATIYPTVLMLLFLCVFASYGYACQQSGFSGNMEANNVFGIAAEGIRQGINPFAKQENESYVDDNNMLEAIKDELDVANNENKRELADNNVLANAVSTNGVSGNGLSENAISLNAISSNTISVNSTNLELTVSNNSMEAVFTRVEKEYFDDALFIGDSRMAGLCYYSGLDNASFYAKTSLDIYKMMDTKPTTALVESIRQGLTDNQFGKIYIMTGINEIGTGDTKYFISHYKEVIEEIRSLQPDAIIYVQGILHVTKSMSDSHRYINNANINDRNNGIRDMAKELGIYYLDVNPVYDDEYGNLPASISGDEVHLLGKCYEPWTEFLLDSAVVFD